MTVRVEWCHLSLDAQKGCLNGALRLKGFAPITVKEAKKKTEKRSTIFGSGLGIEP